MWQQNAFFAREITFSRKLLASVGMSKLGYKSAWFSSIPEPRLTRPIISRCFCHDSRCRSFVTSQSLATSSFSKICPAYNAAISDTNISQRIVATCLSLMKIQGGGGNRVSLCSLHITASNVGRFLKFFHCHITYIHTFMFICTKSVQNVSRITTNMQDRKVMQDSYNCPKSLN